MYPAWPTYYVYVHFLHGSHAYTYRTQDRSINVNDIVLVPVGPNDELKQAIVAGVHTEPPSDFPVEKIKWIAGMAGPADRAQFLGIDMRVPLDISVKPQKGPTGEISWVPTTREERIRLRQQYGNDPKTKIVEERYPTPAPSLRTAPQNPPLYVSVRFQNKTYTYRTHDRSIKVNDVVMVPVGPKGELLTATVSSVSKAPPAGWSAKELDQLKWVERKTEPPPPPPTAYWTQITHLLDPDEFICSHCHYVTTKKGLKICPQCSARMKETKYVASWVDEAEWFDTVLGP